MNVLQKLYLLAGLFFGWGALQSGEIVLNLQQSTDGMSGWENVPVSSVDLTAEGGISGGTVAPGESVFYRLEILEVEPPTPVTLVINEVDYDQVGADANEFVEILNTGTEAVDLTNIALVLVNGSGSASYNVIDLGAAGTLAAGGYLVVASSTVVVDAGATTILFGAAENNVQNGGPDALAVVNMATGDLIDALSYEGSITAATITGLPGTFNLVEGTATTLSDSNTEELSLVRFPNGTDTDDASVDWWSTAVITPGSANIVLLL